MEALKVMDVIEERVIVPANIKVVIGHLHGNDFFTVNDFSD
jgi:hypothetical protein